MNEDLRKYIPSVQEKPYTSMFVVIVSVVKEAMIHTNLNPWKRLEGLETSPQEFHHSFAVITRFFMNYSKVPVSQTGILYVN